MIQSDWVWGFGRVSPACWIRVALCLDRTLLPSVVLHPVEWVSRQTIPPIFDTLLSLACKPRHKYQLSVNPEDVDSGSTSLAQKNAGCVL